SVKKYESFISQVGKPNLFSPQFSRSREDRNQGVPQQYSRLSILAALKREGPRDGDIDLASVTCLLQFNRIKIMECKLYVRIFQLISANEVRQKGEDCRTDKTDRKPANFALGSPLGSDDGGLRLLKDTDGVRIKYLAFRPQTRAATGSREEFQSKFTLQIGHCLTDRGLSDMQPP